MIITCAARTLQTAPTVEPVSLSDAKLHLRLDSSTFADAMTETQSIKPDAWPITASYGIEGTGVDRLGKKTLCILNVGVCGGTLDAKVQESDDNVTFTDWTGGAFTQRTAANDETVQEIEYTGTKQYVRVVGQVASGACDFAATIITKAATHTDDDYVTALITAARDYAEAVTGRALITQTWDFFYSDFPGGDRLRVPLPPLQSVTGVYYTDTDGTETEFSSDYYDVDTKSTPGRVVLKYGETWPSETLRPYLPVRIRAVCGYGDAATSVPVQIVQAMKIRLTQLYEQREKGPEKALDLLLYQYRVWLK